MLFQKLLIIFEILLFFSSLIVLIFSELIKTQQHIPYAFEVFGTLTVISIFLFALPNLKKHPFIIPWYQAAGLSILGFGAVQLSPQILSSPSISFPALYFLIVLINSLLGKKINWIISFIILTTGEIATLFLTHFSNIDTFLDCILNPDSIYSLIYLFCTGFIPSIFNQITLVTTDASKKTFMPQPEIPSSEKVQTPVINNNEKQVDISNTPKNSPLNHVPEIYNQNADNVQELLYSIVYFMSRNFKAHSALGFIFNATTQSFELNSFQSKSAFIAKGISIPLGKGIIGKTGIEKRPFMSGNLPLYNSEILYYTSPVEVNSLLAVPIISDQQEMLGVLVLDCIDKNAFKDQDKEILKRFSILAAALITNARIRVFQERAAHTFQIFYQASHRFTTSLNLEDVFEVLFTTVPMVTPCTRQVSIVFDENRNVGRVLRIIGSGSDVAPGMEFPINRGLYSFTFQKRKVVNIGDYLQYQSKYYRFFQEEYPDPSIRSLIIFPITDDEFRCRGIFSIESNRLNQFTGDTEQILSTIMENASVAFTRAVLYQKMEKLATTDGLTGLNNHRNFQEILSKELERARRYKHPLSLLLMDIDHFKTFNDTYGHPVGDLVLKEISLCIQKSIRTNDIPARYGGEEFTVIIPECDQKGALIIAERVRFTIENHIVHSLDKELRVTVSIGCASFPFQVSSQQELIDCADKALYYSKEHGRNQTNAYLPTMTDNEKNKKK